MDYKKLEKKVDRAWTQAQQEIIDELIKKFKDFPFDEINKFQLISFLEGLRK